MSASPQKSNRNTKKEEQQGGMEEEKEEEEKKEVKKEEKESWTDFIYNRRSGEVLGRTCGSWGEFCGRTEPNSAASVGSVSMRDN